MNRSNGSLSFARSWSEYETGFGDGTDFWIGLRTINELCGSTPRLLRMEAVSWSNVFYASEFSGFSVANASTSYTMTLSSYLAASSNTSGDSLTYHKGMKFSTMDRDNDLSGSSCSQSSGGNGGWWFNSCSMSNPSGVYYTSAVTSRGRMCWPHTDGNNALKSIRLMLLMP
uniref:Fibrinogen C-terminal domain-containing protein n=1 Tax=Macrostomum lignano TaxID=282301 RepID=A0A1I8GX66_9PLAT